MKIKGACVFVFCNAKQERPSSGHAMGNFHLAQAVLQSSDISPGHSSEEDTHDKKFSLLLDILVLLD